MSIHDHDHRDNDILPNNTSNKNKTSNKNTNNQTYPPVWTSITRPVINIKITLLFTSPSS
eukprot:m.119142 g.119142  ORF g.119142 m.119142 type:complete len:60 (-) comp28720_c1_seq4:1688-1867(-)